MLPTPLPHGRPQSLWPACTAERARRPRGSGFGLRAGSPYAQRASGGLRGLCATPPRRSRAELAADPRAESPAAHSLRRSPGIGMARSQAAARARVEVVAARQAEERASPMQSSARLPQRPLRVGAAALQAVDAGAARAEYEGPAVALNALSHHNRHRKNTAK